MASVENLVAELKALTPDQLERVAQVGHELSAESCPSECSSSPVVSNSVLEQAIQNGWPPTLFTDVIGHIDEDFERPPQLPNEIRPALQSALRAVRFIPAHAMGGRAKHKADLQNSQTA